jgi:hypothetical protein
MPISSTENIVRAVCSDKWDGKRMSPSLFEGKGTSVSRLAVIRLEDHFDLFTQYVQKPPERVLNFIAEINVGVLIKLGVEYIPRHDLTVEPVPLPWNPAHAEIPQKISRGLANKILAVLQLHDLPSKR